MQQQLIFDYPGSTAVGQQHFWPPSTVNLTPRSPHRGTAHLDQQQPDEHELELQAAEHGGLGDDQGEHGQTQPVRGNSHQAKHSKDIQLLIRLECLIVRTWNWNGTKKN